MPSNCPRRGGCPLQHRVLVSAFFVLAIVTGRGLCAESSPEKAPSAATSAAAPDIQTREDLLKVIEGLKDPETKMAALARLIRFADSQLYQVGSVFFSSGDANRDELQREAAKAAYGCVDLATVLKAMDSPDGKIQFFGIWTFGSSRVPHAEWVPHLPKLERLIDGSLGWIVIERLEQFSEEKKFLAARLEVETNPSNLMKLERRAGYASDNWSGRFCRRLERLLDHADAKVRLGAIQFISYSGNNAPMWQVDFDAPVLDRVVVLTQSAAGDERKAALDAVKRVTDVDCPADPGRCPAWWKEHRAAWESGAMPRWSYPYGGLRACIEKVLTEGHLWPFSITVHLQNTGRQPIHIDVGHVAHTYWKVYNAKGERVQAKPYKMDYAGKRPDWRELGPGQEAAVPMGPAPWRLSPGRYMLDGELVFAAPDDRIGLPEGWVPFGGVLRLPGVPFEVPALPPPVQVPPPATGR